MSAAGSSAPASQPAVSQLDVVFDGAWVIGPSVDGSGAIVGVNVYSPACGHPHGAVFSAQLGPIPIANWPAANAFYMLDSHSHSLNIQRGSGSPAGIHISAKSAITGGNCSSSMEGINKEIRRKAASTEPR